MNASLTPLSHVHLNSDRTRLAFTCADSISYCTSASDVIRTLKNGIARSSCIYLVFRADLGLEAERSAL